MDAALRVAELEDLVARQAERIAQMETALGQGWQPPVEWQLPRREAQIFGLLVARERVTKEMVMMVAYPDEPDQSETVIESHVSKMRKRLRPFGVVIESERFLGYRLVNRESFRWAP